MAGSNEEASERSDEHYGKGSSRESESASRNPDSYQRRDRQIETEQETVESATDDSTADTSNQTTTEDEDRDWMDQPRDERDNSNLSDEFYEGGITPTAPPEVNIDDYKRFIPLHEHEDIEPGGANSGNTYLGHTPDGRTSFIKTVRPSTMASHEAVATVNDALQEDELPDEKVPDSPVIQVDTEREAVSVEDKGGEDTAPPIGHRFERGSVNRESYRNSWAFKAVSGDWDIGGNIIAKWNDDEEEYQFSPVDFDFASEAEVGSVTDNEHIDDIDGPEELADQIGGMGRGVDGIEQEECVERMQEYANAIDLDVIDDRIDELEQATYSGRRQSRYRDDAVDRLNALKKIVKTARGD